MLGIQKYFINKSVFSASRKSNIIRKFGFITVYNRMVFNGDGNKTSQTRTLIHETREIRIGLFVSTLYSFPKRSGKNNGYTLNLFNNNPMHTFHCWIKSNRTERPSTNRGTTSALCPYMVWAIQRRYCKRGVGRVDLKYKGRWVYDLSRLLLI